MDTNTSPSDDQNQDQDKDQDQKSDFNQKLGSADQDDKKSLPDDKESGKDSDDQKTSDKDESPPDDQKKTDESQHDFEKRYKDTQSALQDKSEENVKAVKANAKLVSKNPDLVDELTEEDSEFADKVVKEAFGFDSVEAYKKNQELEKMKEDDPDKYDKEKRLQKVENKVDESEKTRRKETLTGFLAVKHIKDNQFDDDNKKLMKALNNDINPELVEKDYFGALSKAFQVAFPDKYSEEDIDKAKVAGFLSAQTNRGGGNIPPTGGFSGKDSERSPGSRAFGDQMKNLTGDQS